MDLARCELIWLKHLPQELRFGKDESMELICDNQDTLCKTREILIFGIRAKS